MIYQNKGFTLVELLIVVAVIGILASIAIPQFSSYRQKSYCALVKSDLANLAIAEEAYFYDYDQYIAVSHNADSSSNVPEFYWSAGVTLVSSTADNSKWTASADHSNCNESPYTYDSSAGGFQ